MKILIAEDDNTSRRILEVLLAKWGYETVSVDNGKKAWDILKCEDAPRLAVIDWMMPEMGGIELCQKAKRTSHGSYIYILLLTAKGQKENIVEGIQAGADDYLIKPFNNDELQARIGIGKRIVELQASLADRIDELQNALDHINTLQGILPICMYCHKIRTDQESWDRLEKYISEHSAAEFSHSICPECMGEHFPNHSEAGVRGE